MKRMDKDDEVPKLVAFYEQDSKRFHRYLIDNNEWGIVGHIYLPKGMEPVPKRLEVGLEGILPTEEEEEEEEKKA